MFWTSQDFLLTQNYFLLWLTLPIKFGSLTFISHLLALSSSLLTYDICLFCWTWRWTRLRLHIYPFLCLECCAWATQMDQSLTWLLQDIISKTFPDHPKKNKTSLLWLYTPLSNFSFLYSTYYSDLLYIYCPFVLVDCKLKSMGIVYLLYHQCIE